MSLNLGTLHASIDLRLDRLERGLADAEKKFTDSGKRIDSEAAKMKARLANQLGDLGRILTIGVTAPIAALGTAAVKAAVNMDSLKRGLNAVTGSAKESAIQLERLKEVAKLPGLSFEGAIRGSINLQAAGMSAQMAERSLMAFGNALATVGKGAESLNFVNLAITQLSNKTSGFGQDIRQLQEHLPQVRRALMSAFGTADTEIINKMDITGAQVVEKIVREFEKLPKATGGIANAFENARDSANRALAAIGEVVLPGIARALDVASRNLEGFAAAWKDLPPLVQNAVLGAGGIAASLGLVSLGISGVMKATETLGPLFARIAPLLANPYVLAAAAVAALGFAIYTLIARQEDAEKAALKEAQAERASAEAKEKNAAAAVKLYGEYETLSNKTNKTAEEKKRLQEILNDISKFSPEVVKAYDSQGNAVKLYADSVRSLAEAQMAASRAAEIAMMKERALNAVRLADRAEALRQEKAALQEKLRSGIYEPGRVIAPTGPGPTTQVPPVRMTPALAAQVNARLRQIEAELAGPLGRNAQREAQGFAPLRISGRMPPASVPVDEGLNRAGRLMQLQERLKTVQNALKAMEDKTYKTNAERNRAGGRQIRLKNEEDQLLNQIAGYDPDTIEQNAKKHTDKLRQVADAIHDTKVQILKNMGEDRKALFSETQGEFLKKLNAGVPEALATQERDTARAAGLKVIADKQKSALEKLKQQSEKDLDLWLEEVGKKRKTQERIESANAAGFETLRDELATKARDNAVNRINRQVEAEVEAMRARERRLQIEEQERLEMSESFAVLRPVIGVRNREIGEGDSTEIAGHLLGGRDPDPKRRFQAAQDRIRQSFGGILGQEIAYEFTDSFARGLEKAFGSSSIGKIFSRAITRWMDAFMQGAVDRTIGGIANSIGKGGKSFGIGDVLGSFLGPVGKIFGFAEGGLVPGRLGEPRPAIVHGGEFVVSRKMQEQGAMGAVTVNLGGVSVANDYDVDRLVDRIAYSTKRRLAVNPGTF